MVGETPEDYFYEDDAAEDCFRNVCQRKGQKQCSQQIRRNAKTRLYSLAF